MISINRDRDRWDGWDATAPTPDEIDERCRIARENRVQAKQDHEWSRHLVWLFVNEPAAIFSRVASTQIDHTKPIEDDNPWQQNAVRCLEDAIGVDDWG